MSSMDAPFAQRMRRAVDQAVDARLSGGLITPGPDLVYLTGYQPTAITERITMLACQAGRDPAMLVPVLERPDAEAAPGTAAVALSDWTDGSDQYAAASALLEADGRYAISDSAWAVHVVGPQAAPPRSDYLSKTAAPPVLRGVEE